MYLGLRIFDVTRFYQFDKRRAFMRFAEETISARRAADDGTGTEIKGMVQKLKGIISITRHFVDAKTFDFYSYSRVAFVHINTLIPYLP